MRHLRISWRAFACAIVAVAVGACAGTGSSSGSSGEPQVLTGNERFGWDQLATSRDELTSFRYALYVDGTRVEASEVTCGNTPSAAGYPCTCRLPQMAPGPHTLQVAAFVSEGDVVKESSRSEPVRVTVR
jgi:hypothetical protein